MSADDRRVIMASIDALAEELKEVIDIAKKRGADDVWLLTYVVAELPYVMRFFSSLLLTLFRVFASLYSFQ